MSWKRFFFQTGWTRLHYAAGFVRKTWTYHELFLAKVLLYKGVDRHWTIVRAGWADYENAVEIEQNRRALVDGPWSAFANPGHMTCGVCSVLALTQLRSGEKHFPAAVAIEFVDPVDMVDAPVLLARREVEWPTEIPRSASCFEISLTDMQREGGELDRSKRIDPPEQDGSKPVDSV